VYAACSGCVVLLWLARLLQGLANRSMRIQDLYVGPVPIPRFIKEYSYSLFRMCFFVLCNRHWFNKAPGPDQGDRTWAYLCDFVTGGFVVTESSTGPRKRFREKTATHGGGHGRGFP
jgi:hypothetical protein